MIQNSFSVCKIVETYIPYGMVGKELWRVYAQNDSIYFELQSCLLLQ